MTEAGGNVRPARRATVAGWALVAGAALVAGLATAVIVAVAGMALGATTGGWIVVPALLGATGTAWLFWRTERHAVRRVVVTVASLALLVVISGVVAGRTADTSVDGRHYHAEGVWALAAGWNPLRDGPTPHTKDEGTDRINSFPKGMWILEAGALDLGVDIAGAKMFGILLAVAAGLVSFATLKALSIRSSAAALLAVALALNPVASAQFSTKMVDGVMASLGITGVMLVILFAVDARRRALATTALVATVVLLVNTKYTGIVFVVLGLAPIGLFAAWRVASTRVVRTLVVVLGSSTIVAVLLVGWNPYVTNTIRHSNPLYLAVGAGSVDPAAGFDVGRIHDASELERRFLSLVASPSSDVRDPSVRPSRLLSSSSWSVFRSPGVAIGGFGPLFILGLVGGLAVALLGAIVTRGSPRPAGWSLLTMAAAVLVVTWVITPAAWISRLAPQLWAVPLLLVAALLVEGFAPRAVRLAALAVVALLALNAVGVAGSAAVWNRRDTQREAASLRRLRALPGPLEARFGAYRKAEERRLRSGGIRFRAVGALHCPAPFVLSTSGSIARAKRGSEARGAVVVCPRTVA